MCWWIWDSIAQSRLVYLQPLLACLLVPRISRRHSALPHLKTRLQPIIEVKIWFQTTNLNQKRTSKRRATIVESLMATMNKNRPVRSIREARVQMKKKRRRPKEAWNNMLEKIGGGRMYHGIKPKFLHKIRKSGTNSFADEIIAIYPTLNGMQGTLVSLFLLFIRFFITL